MPNIITRIGGKSENVIVVRSDNKTVVNNCNGGNTIKMIVRSSERGPKGENGRDGFVQYRSGPGIFISNDNVISATGGGGGGGIWGQIVGDIQDQEDLQTEFGKYTKTVNLANVATSGSYNDLANRPTINNATLTIKHDGVTAATFTANSATNATANIVSPVNIGSVVSEPTDAAYVGTNNIVSNAVTTSKIADGAVTASKIDFTTLSGNYSLDEQDTGFTWIDGKTIYKKTIDFGALPNATDKTVAHGIVNLHRIIEATGYAFRSNDSTGFPIPFVSNANTNLGIGFTWNSSSIVLGTGVDRSNATECYITLYYIKN